MFLKAQQLHFTDLSEGVRTIFVWLGCCRHVPNRITVV